MGLATEWSLFRAAAVIGLIGAVAACGGGGNKKSGGASACESVPDPASFITSSAVAAGDNHSLALRRDGIVCSWGANANGQLGDGSTTGRTVPGRVNGLSGVVGIAAGHTHSLALKADGTVWAWGANFSGELGNGTFADRPSPVQVAGLSDVVAIAAGDSFSLALKSDGTVWAWGTDENGQLGDGTFSDSAVPVQGLFSETIQDVAAGGLHGLALGTSGGVWAWGYNLDGQLGIGSFTTNPPFGQSIPAAVVGLSGVVAVRGGNTHSMALKNDGTVWTWGDNTHGQLGTGLFGTDQAVPVQTLNLDNVSVIAGGFTHSLALKAGGSAYAWGWNFFGQLGDGGFTDSAVPLQLPGLGNGLAVAGGGAHSLAAEGDGSVWAWGDNQSGQLGDGTLLSPEPLPVRVIDLNL